MTASLNVDRMIELRDNPSDLMLHLRADAAISRVIDHHIKSSNLPSGDLQRFCLPEVLPIQLCIGDDLTRSFYQGELKQMSSVHHIELSLQIALTAVEILNSQEMRWRLWAGKVRLDDSGPNSTAPSRISELPARHRAAWVRTMMRAALCMPLGYLVSHTLISSRKGLEGWNPALSDMCDYIAETGKTPNISPSNLSVAPRMLSYATYQRLYGTQAAGSPTLVLAEADFFSDHPSRSNPLRLAWRDAILKILTQKWQLPFPYWWVLAINHELVGREGFQLLKCEVIDELTQASLSAPEPLELIPSPESKSTNEDSDNASTSNAQQHGKPSDASTSHALLANRVREQIEQGEFKMNCKGAVIHRADGEFFVSHPLFWKLLEASIGDPSKDIEYLTKAFIDAGFVSTQSGELVEKSFAIIPADSNKRAGKFKGVLLTKDFVNQAIIHESSIADNPDLREL